MEHDSQDFGSGLVAYLSRNPRWHDASRELVTVPYVQPLDDAPTHRWRSSLTIVPLLAAFVAELAG